MDVLTERRHRPTASTELYIARQKRCACHLAYGWRTNNELRGHYFHALSPAVVAAENNCAAPAVLRWFMVIHLYFPTLLQRQSGFHAVCCFVTLL